MKADFNFSWPMRGLHREPLRTLDEMAEEFGIKKEVLKQLIAFRHGPPSELTSNGGRLRPNRTYYVPSRLRKWWKELEQREVGEDAKP